MITIYNSNIDFDLDSSNSILLSNSNLVFKTRGLNRMTIMDTGNIGIGLENPAAALDVIGTIKSSGMITSTGAGFSGRGDNLTNIPLDGIPQLIPTLALLRGDTSNTTSNLDLNISGTSNILVNRTLLETGFGSNYTGRINSELNTRIENTSNYVLSTSNILVGRIRTEFGLTSNYVLSSSNNLILRENLNDANASNYILSSSNNLILRENLNDANASNYVLTASNNLINKIRENDNNSSNYNLTASNNLINKIRENDNNSSNYILTASNNLINKVKENDNNSSNYILTASNNLINKVRENDNNSSNYILTASNNLINRTNLNDSNSSNYVARITSFLIDYNNLINRPDGAVTTNNANTSNYVLFTSNIVVNRIVEEVGRGSNYTLSSSNNLVNRVVDEVGRGSNYTLSSSNNLVNRVVDEVGRGSNYTLSSSNNLVNRVIAEVGRGSNYTLYSSNDLVNRAIAEVGRGSNYTLFSSNNLVNRTVAEVGFGSNYADRVGIFGSNYTDKVGIFGSNYTDRVGIFGSNYILSTSNILVGRILTEAGFTSNYTKRLNDIAMISSQWTTDSTTIFYNSGNIGIGTTNPINNLHIYSCNNTNIANAKLTIQEANTSNLFSAYPSDIVSVPAATIATTLPSTIDKYMIFTYTTDNTGTGQTQYAITLPENYSCDILMVGGGGGGGGDIGGGGGGGAVLYGSNIIIPAGTYNIKVGAGGSGTGQNGYNTEGFGSICLGGGGAKNKPWESSGSGGANNGNSGGSGGGGKSYNTAGGPAGAGGTVGVSTKSALLAAAVLYNGNVGGAGSQLNNGDKIQSGGGGGAGTAGGSGQSEINLSGTAAGGNGVLINVLNISATNVYWAAGGGGAGYFAAAAGNGGLGGGGAGTKTFFTTSTGTPGASGYSAASGMNAGASTGSGGGGGAGQGTANYPSNGGNGGSGIIIIRYRQIINMKGTPEMQLVIGNTIASGGSNYKIGNYNGDFQIKTSTSNVDTTSLIIQNTANVGIGTNVISSKLHLYDSASNAIFTIQDNTSTPTLALPSLITTSVVSPATSSVSTTTFLTYERLLVLTYTSDSAGFTGQTSYTLTIPEDINADILVVAGGGAGGFVGGGGGGGQVLFTTNYNIAAGTSISVNIGKGGIGNNTAGTNGQNGFNSSITIAGSSFIANGGGGGGSRSGITPFNARSGSNGGSGGGSSTGDVAPYAIGGIAVENTYTNWISLGYNGGIGSYITGANPYNYSGGGGGAGKVGGTGVYFNNTVGAGGDGVNLSGIFGSTQGAGGWFGGGGGGINEGPTSTTPSGGAGGGGKGATSTPVVGSDNGTATSGGGGGGSISSAGANGGSGVVIIRYRQRNREGNAEIQFIKGSSISAGYTNYKIGNYRGDFQIKSSVLGADTNRLVIGSTGNVTLSGSLNAASYLLNGAPFSIATEVGNASNYVLSTSNFFANRVSSQWTSISSGIYYNTSNVGIGATAPVSKLHIYDDTVSNTSLTIQNNNVSGTPSIELIRGTSGDTNADYKIGNYGGEFQIKSSVSSVDTNRLVIGSTGNITVSGSLNATSYLLNGSPFSIATEVGNASNYVLSTSNNLVNRVVAEVGRGSNYVLYSSNDLVNRVVAEVGRGSNYVLYSSNDLVNRVVAEVGRGSNYVLYSSNLLASRITTDIGNTSNFVLSTSNFFANRVSSQWTDVSSGIYFNTSNVGIGTANPLNKLHISDNTISNTTITIQNNLILNVDPIVPTGTSITTGIITTTANSTDRYMIFTTGASTFTIQPGGLNCDILMIGGGGAGYSGGGGAGACIVAINQTLPAGSCVVYVGAGGPILTNGEDSFIQIGGVDRYRAKGGGGVPEAAGAAGNAGGCGGGGNGAGNGGGAVLTNVITLPNGTTTTTGPTVQTTYAVLGNPGGTGSNGSGGGIGAAGVAGGAGGNGKFDITFTGASTAINFRNYFANGSTSFGVKESTTDNYYIGGGGGSQNQPGGLGGGSGGAYPPPPGRINTGSGGSNGIAGGSGIIIIRYRATVIGSGIPALELIRGSSGDANTDYKFGNYGGDLRIKSSNSSADTDRFIIQNDGTVQFNNASGTSMATISSTGDLWARGSITNNSDNRIKKDIEDIDYRSALSMILAIKPKTYKYIDGDETSDSRIYGFIAQQIRDIIPDATELHKDFLPNIMKWAICNKNRVYLDLTKYTDLPLNEDDRRINIRFKNGKGDNFNIIEVNENYFVVEKKYSGNRQDCNRQDCNREDCPDGEVFVYGYEVKDFHKLTKDYIFTLNVSATQELHRYIETQNVIIKSYGERIKELEEKIALAIR